MHAKHAAPDHMAAYGAALLARGYDIIPIKQGLKHPGMTGWQSLRVGLRHDAERLARGSPSSAAMVAKWSADPSLTGVGVMCSTVFGIDCDLYDDFVADHVARLIEARVGVSTRRIGQAPKVLIPYRCAQPMREGRSARYRDPANQVFDATGKELFHGLDFWGDGRQFVAEGNHPDTGAPYYYDGPRLADLERDALPLIDADDVAHIQEAFAAVAVSLGWDAVDRATEAGLKVIDTTSTGDPFEFVMPTFGASLDEARAMLAKIDPDLPGDAYDIAIKAVCHEFDGSADALQVLQDWASQGVKWADSGVSQLRTRWERAKRGAGPTTAPVRLATIQDWINKGTHAADTGDAFPVVDEPAAPKKKRGFEILSEFVADTTPHNWTIRGIITHGEMSMLFADPESYKSFIALDMAMHIATGRDWHGRRVKKGAVLIIAGEGRHGLKARVRAWCRHHGVDPEGVMVGVSRDATPINEPEPVKMLAKEIAEFSAQYAPPVLVIVDTLARNNSGNENDAVDAGVFVSHVGKLQAHFDCAFLLIHHTGTSNKERGRGSSAIPGALDSSYRLERQGDLLVAMTCTKMKDAPHPPAKWFAGDVVELDPAIDPDTGDTVPVNSLVFSETEARTGEASGAASDPRQGLRGVQLAVYDLIAAEGPVDRDTLYGMADTLAGEPWGETARKRREQVRMAVLRMVDKGLVSAPDGGKIATVEHLNAADGMPVFVEI